MRLRKNLSNESILIQGVPKKRPTIFSSWHSETKTKRVCFVNFFPSDVLGTYTLFTAPGFSFERNARYLDGVILSFMVLYRRGTFQLNPKS